MCRGEASPNNVTVDHQQQSACAWLHTVYLVSPAMAAKISVAESSSIRLSNSSKLIASILSPK